ncbi:DUF4384 domain-containing protein [Azospirillum sp. A39]|uniref:DUF4384 domain-containing protein n=1 Tax=Azospirillum sp. A39 TaxID=3462279 RepID=UPI004045A646
MFSPPPPEAPVPAPVVEPPAEPPPAPDFFDPPPAKPPVPPPLPPLDAEVERVRAGLGDVRCAAVRVEAAGETLAVSGTVTSEADRAQIVSLVDKARSDVVHRIDVAVASRALCEPLAVVEGLQAANAGRAVPLSVAPASADGRFRGGEALLLDLALPDFDAHLYVDYFTADGMVVHLLPNPSEPAARLAAGQTRRLGGAQPGQRFWTIGPPFGHELVVALASPTPLFAEPRPEAEPAGRYLADLRAAFAAVPDAVADAVFVTTAAP